MNTNTLEEIKQLSVAERIQLVEDIWDSIAAAPESLALPQSQRDELDNRLQVYAQNSATGSPWDEVSERLKSQV